MITPTKDQVRKLTPEQQEALGAAEIQRSRSHQQLLERARHGMNASAGLFTGLAGGLAILCIPVPQAIPFAITVVVALLTYHVVRIYRRLDAIMTLLDKDSMPIRKSAKSDEAPSA